MSAIIAIGGVSMDPGHDQRRELLTRVRHVVEHYERHSTAGPAIMRGVRYDLAVRATDLNGDGCLFPACGCAKADCAERRGCAPPDVSAWIEEAKKENRPRREPGAAFE
ncbi:hypothetical protein [Azospirillum sp. A29]|uniref:hypothetical protein n=1 Tax=Azospirillum sp. A29 TaxID=3160606 RepID=UPI003672A3ED